MDFGGVSWADEVALVSAILTPIGLAIGIFQLRQSTNAAKAVLRTARQLALYQALLILPQLESIDAEMDNIVISSASDDISPDAIRALSARAERALVLWRQLTGRLRSLLVTAEVGDEGFLAVLQESVVLAGSAKGDLVEGVKSLKMGTRAIRASINDVCAHLGSLSVELIAEAEREDK